MTAKHKPSVSLSEVHGSVETHSKSGKRKFLAFLGPAYLVSVGYMDPGNWATDIAGGSRYGYALIWVLLMSNLMALLLQSLSARLGVVRGRDLAQASRELFPGPINLFLYLLAEIAIAACDLAEVLGMAIGLKLLFDIPLMYGVMICALDTVLLLFLLHYGIRKMEAFIIGLVAVIGGAFLVQMILASPSLPQIATGFIPSIPDATALYIAIGIIGATVMPHNLYLHSALVQTRKFERDDKSIWRAIRFNNIDSTIALNLAFFVNAAILILAGSTFYRAGMYGVSDIMDAHKLLEPLLGSSMAPILFAVALICAGQSSTVTGTLAGQIVMEGYLNLRIAPWIRRIITRLIAITPALITIHINGESSTGDLLILSQVILSLQLGFAVIPLIHFVSDKKKMGIFVISNKIKILAWLSAIIIVGLNVKLVYEQITTWIVEYPGNPIILFGVVPVAVITALVLVYITVKPLRSEAGDIVPYVPHGTFEQIVPQEGKAYEKIAVTLDFSAVDNVVLQNALRQGGHTAKYYLIHVTETAGALFSGTDTMDYETHADNQNMESYASNLRALNYTCEVRLGFGRARKALPDLLNEIQPDLIVMGGHGHRAFKDLLFGSTIDEIRHKVKTPLLIIRME